MVTRECKDSNNTESGYLILSNYRVRFVSYQTYERVTQGVDQPGAEHNYLNQDFNPVSVPYGAM